jgi:hypothetical protein
MFQAEISDNTFLPIMLWLPDGCRHDRSHVMEAEHLVSVRKYDLAFFWMLYDAGLQVIVRGKLILQLHGNEFFYCTVSSFCVVR